LPHPHRFTSELAKRLAGNEMALEVEGVVDGGVDREKSLRRASRLEALHSSLPQPDRQVRALRPIVASPAGDVSSGHAEKIQCGPVGGAFVGYDAIRCEALLLQQFAHQLQRSHPVAAGLNQDIQNFSFAVDRPPQIHALAIDADEDLIEAPASVGPWTRCSQPPGIGQAEFQRSAPDSLVGDLDAALRKEILDIPEAQWEAQIQPDRVLDDLSREAMTAI
jgi:hypothetical protein